MLDLVVPADVVQDILTVIPCRNLKKPASSQGIIFENKNDELWAVAFSDVAFAARRLEKPLGLDFTSIPRGMSICLLPNGGKERIYKKGYIHLIHDDCSYHDNQGGYGA